MSPMTRAFAAGLAAATAVLITTTSAAAATPPAGVDVSYPQCADGGIGTGTGALPAQAAFAVVGVNDGLATGANPCLGAELTWASGLPGGAGVPATAVYVNTANPSLAAA